MKITSTRSDNNAPLKVLIFGDSGAGKTTLAGTLPGKTLIISAEAGLLSLAGKSIDVVDLSQDDEGAVIPQEKRIARLVEVYKFLQTPEARKKYEHIFIDSLTEINQNLIAQLNQEFPDRKDALVMYGENAKRMRGLVRSFRDLPMYSVYFTALSEIDKDENGMRFLGPQLVGKMSAQVNAFFDEVFYLHVDKETGARALITAKTDNLAVKDRSGKLDAKEPANLEVIIKKIKLMENSK